MVLRAMIFAAGLLLSACASVTPRAPSDAPMVVLKLDDFRADGPVHPGWEEVFRFLNEENVIATVGMIGQGLEKPDPRAVNWLLAQDARRHELWNHGYCHCRSGEGADHVREFRGAPFAEQQAGITRTQRLGKDVLGISFTTFGAPYNSTDASTALALAEHDELAVWMYKDTSQSAAPTDKQQLERIADVNIEYPVHIPDFEQFSAGYAAHREESVLVIQGHPQSWVEEPERMAQFKRIVLYLKADGVRFVTPSAAVAEVGGG